MLSNRRHHIHVVCAVYDQTWVLDSLAVFFQKRAFLTYDVSRNLPQAARYGRQCIDESDYIIVIVGDSYGETQNLGVSQMHLSYLSAKAKLKPMMVLIKTHIDTDAISRQLKDFTRLVEQQSRHLYYYDDQTNIEQLLLVAYHDLTKHYPLEPSWIKDSTLSNSNSISSLRSSYKVSPAIGNKPTSSAATAATHQTPSGTKTADDAADNVTKSLALTDTYEVQYSAQAYAGGNLSDVSMTMTLSWQEILTALAKIPAAFSQYGLQSCLNRLIASKAEADIKAIMPDVHAVSRCQIAPQDLSEIQCLLVAANWIELHVVKTRNAQNLWRLTFFAKQIFESIKTDTSVQ